MTFGMTLRAYRLGFRRMEGVGFVRIRAGGPPWLVDVFPFDNVKADARSSAGEHLAWWEGETAEIERTIKAHIDREVTEPLTLVLDDDGRTVKPAE